MPDQKSAPVSSEEKGLLIEEYREAGQISRQHETLSRTSATVFIGLLTALLIFIIDHKENLGLLMKIGLSSIGFLVSLLAINVLKRHQLYYASYMDRLHKIEKKLGNDDPQILRLYTNGEFATKNSCTISNKCAFIFLFVLLALSFFASSVHFVYESWPICR